MIVKRKVEALAPPDPIIQLTKPKESLDYEN